MLRLFKVSMLLTACLLNIDLKSQPVHKLWDNVIQGNHSDGSHLEMLKTHNKKLLVSTISSSDSGLDKTMNRNINLNDQWIIMLDAYGAKLWDRDFWGAFGNMGLASLDTDIYVMVSETELGIGGDITAPITAGSSGSSCGWIVAFNSTGDTMWNKRFAHGTDNFNNNHGVTPFDVKGVDGSAYILALNSRNADIMTGGDLTALNCITGSNIDNWDILLYKVNSNDTLTNEWQKVYGGDTAECPVFLYPLLDNNSFYGFLIGGFTSSHASCNQTVSSHTIGKYDFFVIRTDTSGSIIWQQRYGGSNNDYLNGILDAGNGNFLLYGRTTSPVSFDITDAGFNDTAIWVVKINGNNGNIVWDKRFGACNGFSYLGLLGGTLDGRAESSSNTVAGINTFDGGYLIVSNVSNSLPCGDVSEPGKGYEDYWLLKLNSAGNKVWDKRFGGPGFDIAEGLVEMSPGYYIVGGYSGGNNAATNAVGGDKSKATIGNLDLWLIGVVDSAAVLASTQENQQQMNINIYPNPANDELYISIKNNNKSSHHLSIVDIAGKTVLSQPINTDAKINIGNLAKGIYIVEVSDKKGFAVRKKLAKE